MTMTLPTNGKAYAQHLAQEVYTHERTEIPTCENHTTAKRGLRNARILIFGIVLWTDSVSFVSLSLPPEIPEILSQGYPTPSGSPLGITQSFVLLLFSRP